MGLSDLFVKDESLLAIDIGASSVKIIELEEGEDNRYVLKNIGYAPLEGEVFASNILQSSEQVSSQIHALIEANDIPMKRAVVAMPGPSVFTKKIQMQRMDYSDLQENIQFEASNFIPHNINAVKLDFCILGDNPQGGYDVLVVAVKNEVVDSFVDTVSLAGVEVAVVDVDYFAVQNMFELGAIETDKVVAVVNVGARFTSINICQGGKSLFTGDISVGGKQYTDAIAESLQVSEDEAEKIKLGKSGQPDQIDTAKEVIDKQTEYVSAELNRQLSFFWNASGAEEGIEKVYLTGGGSQIPGLLEELSEKTALDCELLDPFSVIDTGDGFDSNYLKEIAPMMSVAVGMAIRKPGDKEIPEE